MVRFYLRRPSFVGIHCHDNCIGLPLIGVHGQETLKSNLRILEFRLGTFGSFERLKNDLNFVFLDEGTEIAMLDVVTKNSDALDADLCIAQIKFP